MIFNPELVSSFLQSNSSSHFFIWTCLRNLEDSCGSFSIDTLKSIVVGFLGIKSTHIYKFIELGENKFWNRSKKDKKLFYLISFKKICSNAEITINRSEPFVLDINIFKSHEVKNTTNIKNIMIGMIASRYVDERPMSLAIISKNTGQSESTVRNALKSCPIIETRYHHKYEQLDNSYFHLTKENNKTNIVQNYLITQLPNTYKLLEGDRLPLGTRPKELKKSTPVFGLTTTK